ncbi:RhoGEF domain protein [Oopsacas minuta]|uniref:RhoGEF domain protein n=1 Tax=Oopsacas minuta TaxID=111878 RepID=A0AAV7JXK2_9METZ|nr:RhoGEF domain protein [Oopsacas minuta]
MELRCKPSLIAQYSSSCSPLEDDIYLGSNAGDDLVGILHTDLIVIPHTGSEPVRNQLIPESWSELEDGSLDHSIQKNNNNNNISRRNRPHRLNNIEQPLSRNNRNNKGVRIPPSVRNTSKKICPAIKKKLIVKTLIYPKGRGVSEEDSMAMGDEWGTERDIGFEDCQEEMVFSNKKKKKDRKLGIPNASISLETNLIHRSFCKPILNTTPRHSRPPHCRPVRTKRIFKRDNYLCGGDISTQETTTPAPDSSDSSSEDIITTDTSTAVLTEISDSQLTTLPSLPKQSPHSSTDSDHNMHTPRSPQITPKVDFKCTDYSEISRTSSDEDNKKFPIKIPDRPPSVVIHDLMPAPSIEKPPICPSTYAVPVKLKTPNSKYRKRSSSTAGIEYMVSPPLPPKPAKYLHMKPPLLIANRRMSQSFSTNDLMKISPQRRVPPSPPNTAVQLISAPLSPLTSSQVVTDTWSKAEAGVYPPMPPSRHEDTCIMPQEEFDSLSYNKDDMLHVNKEPKNKLTRTKSVEISNKIHSSMSSNHIADDDMSVVSRLRDENYDLNKKIHRKDANFVHNRTRSFDFENNHMDNFIPMPGHQPPLTTIGYLPSSMQDSLEDPEQVIQMLNDMAHKKNIKLEISNVTSQESELTVPPLQMCSSANITASNYEDSKGKKFKLVLTFHQVKENHESPKKMSYTTLRRVKVPLWSHQEKVKTAGLVKNLSLREIKRQEAMYEVYTTEVSYKLSLSILAKFRNDSRLNPNLPEEFRVISQTDQTHLFSNACAMLEASKLVATQLRNRVENSLIIESVTDILLNNLASFDCFIPYCKNQYYQSLKYKHLLSHNPKFVEIVTHLERDKECHNLDLTSFLMLPVQRITRLPLLLSNILEYTPEKHEDYLSVKTALLKLREIAYRCDIEAQRLSSLEGLHAISRSLMYPPTMKTLPIVDPKRHLVRRGEIYRVQWRMRKLMRPEIKFERIHLILLTDIAILTYLPKKCMKSDAMTYQVIDYCKRQLLTYNPIGIINKQPFPSRNRNNFYMMSRWVVSRKLIPNAFALHMLENNRERDACYLLVPNDSTEATRWAQAISPPLVPCIPGEQLYHEFEYPQFQAISNYTAQLPDELSLDIGDVVSIRRKMPDGWFEGQRMRDDKQGWFPSNHAVEVVNEATRNKNVRKAQELRRISTLIKYSDLL